MSRMVPAIRGAARNFRQAYQLIMSTGQLPSASQGWAPPQSVNMMKWQDMTVGHAAAAANLNLCLNFVWSYLQNQDCLNAWMFRKVNSQMSLNFEMENLAAC